ncbi:MAG TPA: hypothetical protein VL947_10510, partial [Cytophagales bacterium]|nr:hypothetical protein [Cytophagales bacterium]
GADVLIDPLLIKFANRNNDSIITRDNSQGFLDTLIAGALTSDTGRTVTTNVEWNAQNSNVEFAFEPSPFNVYYKANIVLNKKKVGLPQELNFITDRSMVRVRAEVKLPVVGTLHYLTIADTLDLPKSNGLSSIDFDFDSATFKLNTENGFPLDCKLQLYFLDSSKVVKDSLFLKYNTPILPSAVVALDGKIIAKSRAYYQRAFSKEDYDRNVKNTRYIVILAHLNSFKNPAGIPQSIKISSDNTVKVKLSGEVKAIVNTSTGDN